MWRSDASPRVALLYGLLVVAFFGPALLTPKHHVPADIAYGFPPFASEVGETHRAGNPLLQDVALQFLPFRTLVREQWLAGEWPLWSHALGTGQPLLGNGQSAPFAPLHLLALPLPPLRGMTLAAAWQTYLALLLMHALLRSLGAGNRGASLAAVAYGLSSYSIAWLYHPHSMTAAWIPGVLLGIVTLARAERGSGAGLVVCGLGLALSGHPETVAKTALFCLATAAAAAGPLSGIARARFAGRLAIAGTLCFGLAAPALLPLLEFIPYGDRFAAVRMAPQLVQPPTFAPEFLWPLVNPLAFGSPVDRNWSGPWNWSELCSVYAGALTLAIALAGGLLGTRRVRALWIAAALSLWAAFELAPVSDLLRALPGFEYATNARWRLGFVLALSVAAGLSVESLIASKRSRQIGSLCLLAVSLAVAVSIPPMGALGQRVGWALSLLGLWSAAALLLSGRSGAVGIVATGLLSAELLLLGSRFHPRVDARLDLHPPPAIEAARAHAGEGATPRVGAHRAGLFPNLAALYGMGDPRGNDPMRPAVAAQIIGRRMSPFFQPGQIVLQQGLPPTDFYRYLGIEYFFSGPDTPLRAPWERIYEDPDNVVWFNSESFPRFLFPDQMRIVRPSDSLRAALTLRDFQAAGVALQPEMSNRKQSGSVSVRAIRANGYTLDVASETGGWVVSSVSFVPGWRIEDGAGWQGEALRVNHGFLGFEVPAGRRALRVDYVPRSWRLSWGLFAAALLGCAAWGRLDTDPAR